MLKEANPVVEVHRFPVRIISRIKGTTVCVEFV